MYTRYIHPPIFVICGVDVPLLQLVGTDFRAGGFVLSLSHSFHNRSLYNFEGGSVYTICIHPPIFIICGSDVPLL